MSVLEEEEDIIFDPDHNDKEVLETKLINLEETGAIVEMDPEEAEIMGAFEESAISEEDALESRFDLEN